MPVGLASRPCSPRSTVDAVAAALVPATPSRVSAAALGSSSTDCNKVYPVPCSWCWCWLPPAALACGGAAAAALPHGRVLSPGAGTSPAACCRQASPRGMCEPIQPLRNAILCAVGGKGRAQQVHAAPSQVLCGRARPFVDAARPDIISKPLFRLCTAGRLSAVYFGANHGVQTLPPTAQCSLAVSCLSFLQWE